MAAPDGDHWLVRPATIRRLWHVSIAVLAVLVVLDLVVAHHPHFGIDGTFGFGAWFGFLACVALIVFARAVGGILKRPDTYYDG
ncbi:MAG TPA: hypothetical protein VH835_14165 [Dongiaceae bacterium]|jgi:hypothetical protein